jgi:putative sugar O-methyltransferase
MTTLTTGDLQRRIDELRASPAYESYEFARDVVLRMKEDAAREASEIGAPSGYWQEELAGFEYMLDASPLIVEKLRHHCYHVTGIKVYDYRTHKDRGHEQLAEKLDALVDAAGGRDLLVPESRELGGFGFDIGGDLYNVDTLKFFEVLIALDKGAVLGALRESDERRVVMEIGAGWGGFAYQFKTLWPNTTYVIVDLPELFLFSVTYLKTLFPEARIAFADGSQDLDEEWLEADFVFVPHTRLAEVTPPRLDLTINMVSFQEMTTEQVEAYVRHSAEQGSSYLYSLNRERSLYNPELSGVHEIIERYFWPHPIEVLPVSYTTMIDKSKIAKAKKKVKAVKEGVASTAKSEKAAMDYKHVIGWPRLPG